VTRATLDSPPETAPSPSHIAIGRGADDAGSLPSLGAHDLAEIMGAFTRVTDRLQGAHQALQAEVQRLNHELHETNEQLRRSRQLAALGQMAAGIAHEVRNPLGSIRLYASMLAEDLNDRPGSSRLAQQIARAVSDLDAVVGDVLNFAREVQVRPSTLSVRAVFDQALETCCALLRESSVEVWRDPAAEAALPPLFVDGSLINQALVNLVRNAVEAMSGRGVLNLIAATDETAVDRSGAEGDAAPHPTLLLIIDDTGPGIPEDIIDRIFNPFFTTRPTGTGLGLAIVHRLVDAHGGEIRITRNAAGGASVILRLPAAPKRQEPLNGRTGEQERAAKPGQRLCAAPDSTRPRGLQSNLRLPPRATAPGPKPQVLTPAHLLEGDERARPRS